MSGYEVPAICPSTMARPPAGAVCSRYVAAPAGAFHAMTSVRSQWAPRSLAGFFGVSSEMTWVAWS